MSSSLTARSAGRPAWASPHASGAVGSGLVGEHLLRVTDDGTDALGRRVELTGFLLRTAQL